MKPKVICHIMCSVDGHIQVERWTKPADGTPKSEMMKIYSEIGRTLSTDAWTFGKNTVCDIFPDKTLAFLNAQEDKVKDAPINKISVFFGKRSSKRMFISFDPQANIVYTASQLRGDDILVVLDMGTATSRYLSYLREMSISYLVVENITQLDDVLQTINKEFDIRSISLQGGGILNGSMLNNGMIDELSLVVYPGLDCQKDSISIFDGTIAEFVAKKTLNLLNVQQKKNGVVWLRYKVNN